MHLIYTTLLFGPHYVEDYTVLLILILGNLVNVWTGSCENVMMLGWRQGVLTIVRNVFGFISIVGAILLVSDYGIEGVAIAVSVSVGLSNIVAWWLFKRRMGYNTRAALNIKKSLIDFGS